ncbi:hypothetical protein BofuT4_uP136230.1 [Botrytis cinerea T4]|uniref:Uncharacterized protein n=1 Tax=Botryotinia fuckeliana (strain T4) TaxID=999810 RepID=G2YPN0_BOTF4|nr:hypothetical protein BofuT4_uP136230.1 [Botrytis cinerea T4]
MTIKCLESDVTLMNGRTWTQKNKAKDHHPDGIFSAPKVSFPSITQREFQKAAASSSSDSRHRMATQALSFLPALLITVFANLEIISNLTVSNFQI